MATAKVPVTFSPVDSRKVDAALARIQSKAKGIDFGGGARSIDKLSRPLGKITGQASEFQKSLEASNARVLAFGASVAVINKLSQAFSALVSNTVKVEATFAKINTILGGTNQELQKFGDGIFKVAQQTGTSFDQVAEGALELARQGLGVEQSLQRVSTSLKLVRVAGIDSEKAVAGLTAAIKGFEGAGLTVAQIADKLAEVDTKFAVSTEDLINGLERASASARVAGVSFDELIGVITTVQERTQRGGAVIGNAFKTIFARLGRTDTLSTLEQLGIEVLDAQGNVRSAIPLFTELAAELDKLGLKSVEAGEIIQKVAGVRQRDILISLVEDLNSGQSQFAKSLQVSAGAAGALDAKNEKLNQTLEALINNLTVSGQKLASVLGEIGFTDAAGDILKAVSSIIGKITDVLQGDSIGAKFAQGLVKGIGSVLTGPGLALIGAIFVKLFIDLTKFGVTSLKQILGINRAAEQQKLLQQSVLQTLLQNENIQREILALEGNKVAQEQLLLKIYNQQAAALARVQKAAATVTPGLFGAGFRGGERGVGRTGRGASGYVAAEARDVSRGVGGATAGSKVVSIPNFAFGRGKRGTMIANTSEYFVPNYAGGGDAIFNQNMVKAMGLPSGARKINAASGFIPNFSRNPYIRKGTSSEQLAKKAAAGDKNAEEALAIRAGRVGNPFDAESKGVVMLVPQTSVRGTPINTVFKKPKIGKKGSYNSFIGKAFGIDPNLRSDSKFGKLVGLDNELESAMADSINRIISRVYPSIKTSPTPPITAKAAKQKFLQEGGAGAFGSFRGAMFEAIIEMIVGGSNRDNAGTLDVAFNSVNKDALNEIFGLPKGYKFGDYKNSLLSKDKFISQAIANRGADGYIPNYAGGGLEDAIAREQSAGLPINQIRINQSGSLRSAQNPMGLAVTNTRDEPTGRIPNFNQNLIPVAQRQSDGSFKQINTETKRLTRSLNETSGALDASIGKIFALQLGVSALTSTFSEQGGKMQEFGNSLSSAINTLLVLQAVGASPLGALGRGKGGGIKGLAPFIAGTKGLTRVFGILKGVAGPVALGFTAVDLALKAFTGKGVLGYAKDGLVALGLAASESSKKFASAAEEFAQKTSGLGVGASVNEALSQLQKEARASALGVEAKELSESVLNFSEVSSLRAGKFEAERVSPKFGTVKDTFKIEKEQLKPIQEALGNLLATSGQDIVDAIPGISDENLKVYLESQAEIIKKLDDDVKASIVADLNVQDNIDAAAGSARAAIIALFVRAQKAAEEEAKEVEKGIERVDAGEAATRIALAASRTQNQFDLAAARREATRAQIARQPTGSIRRTEISFENQEEDLQAKAQEARLKIRKSLIEQVKLQDSLTGIDKQKLEILEKQVGEFGSIEEIQKTIEGITSVSLKDFEEQVRLAKLQNTQLDDTLEKDKQILAIRKEQALETAKANKGLAKYSQKAQQDLINQAEDLPNILATNLENSMAQTFKNLANGAYDSVGDAFLQIALNFGQELQNQINQRMAKQVTDSLFGEGTAGGGLIDNISNAITGGGKKSSSSSGGSGGGFFSNIGGSLQSGFGKIGEFFGYNTGGLVMGGSGVGDDVPALLTGGEYVIKKSAVQKYGSGFFDSINNTILGRDGKPRMAGTQGRGIGQGDFFIPGTRGAGTIQGKDDLLGFAFQQSTSGATDIIRSSGSGASINLEDQSARLTTFGRFRDSPARQSLKKAQEQAYNLYLTKLQDEERARQARKQRSNMFKNAVKGAFINAAVSAAAPGLGNVFNKLFKEGGEPLGPVDNPAARVASQNRLPGAYEGSNFLLDSNFYSGLFQNQSPSTASSSSPSSSNPYQSLIDNNPFLPPSERANGGAISSNSNALLMGGEYVLSSAAASRIGRNNLDDINMMRYSNGGPVGGGISDSSSNGGGVGEVNITINMEKGDASVEENSNGGADPTQTKEFAKRIKDVVVGVINEEKRVSGSLFTRRK